MSPSLVLTIPLSSELSKSIILELNADDLSLAVREIPEGLLPSSLLQRLNLVYNAYVYFTVSSPGKRQLANSVRKRPSARLLSPSTTIRMSSYALELASARLWRRS